MRGNRLKLTSFIIIVSLSLLLIISSGILGFSGTEDPIRIPEESKILEAQPKPMKAGLLNRIDNAQPLSLARPGGFSLIECDTLQYDNGVAKFYFPLPDKWNDDYFNVRFTAPVTSHLNSVALCFYKPGSHVNLAAGTYIYIWNSDGTYPTTVIDSVMIENTSLKWYPNFTWVDLTSENIIVSGDFHVGYSPYGVNDTLAIISDSSYYEGERSVENWNGTWGTMKDDWGDDINFFIRAEVCPDTVTEVCDVIQYDNDWDKFYWKNPNRYYNVRFTPPSTGLLYSAGFLFYEEHSYVTQGARVYIWNSDGTHPTTVIDSVDVPPSDIKFSPEFTWVDLYQKDIWVSNDFHIGYKPLGSDTIPILSDSSYEVVNRSGMNYGGTWYTLNEYYGIDYNFFIRCDICYSDSSLGHIAGFVKDTLNQPIFNTEVKLCDLPSVTYTNSQGYYQFLKLIPQDYTLIAHATNYSLGEGSNVTVVKQETTWVDFTLKPEYFSRLDYHVSGGFNWSLETGDFNADNNVDLIALSVFDTNGVNRLWGLGDGTFNRQTTIPSDFGIVLVKGYFNSDDFLDLAVAEWDSIAILLNNGSGNFLTPKRFGVHGEQPMSITKGFLNSDANVDLVTANTGTQNLSIFRGVGNGDFVFVKNLNIGWTASVDVGDFNKDGKTDLVVGANDSLIVLLGDGNLNFTRSSATYFGSIWAVSTMNSLADFNHDGNLDVIFALPVDWATSHTARVAILLGDGAGGFSFVTILYAPWAQVYALAPGDFNGDNNLDFAASYSGRFTSAVKAYFGDGTGNFPQNIITYIGHSSMAIATGDFNKDGNADIVSGNLEDTVSVLLNLNPPKPTIEDEFVLTGYTSVNLNVTDMYGSSANILANAIAGADYYQKDCNLDSALDDRVYNFNAFPGRYVVGVTARPGTEPGSQYCLGIRIDGTDEVMVSKSAMMAKGTQNPFLGDTIFFIITDSLPTLRQPRNDSCLCRVIDTLTFFWNKIEGVTQYNFQLDDTIKFSSPIVDDSAVVDTSFRITTPLGSGKFYWRVRANGGVWSVFSNPYSFITYLRGDVNCSRKIDLSDVIYLANYILKGGPPPIPLESGDVNCDGKYDLVDVIKLAKYVLLGESFPC